MSNEITILGIDPGLNTTGYGVIRVKDLNRFGTRVPILCEAGIVRCGRNQSLEKRLAELYQGITEVFEAHPIQAVALEEIFSRYDRPKTAILMGHARGVLCLAAAQHNAPVFSYLPTKIKKILTGNGHAPKDQMQSAVRQQLNLVSTPKPADVADALAAAICHVHASRSLAA